MSKVATVIVGDELKRVVSLLTHAINPVKIILFGSHATEQASEDSDFDIMVIVKDKPANKVSEATRLRGLIAPIDLNVDLILVHEEKFEYWKDTINTVY